MTLQEKKSILIELLIDDDLRKFDVSRKRKEIYFEVDGYSENEIDRKIKELSLMKKVLDIAKFLGIFVLGMIVYRFLDKPDIKNVYHKFKMKKGTGNRMENTFNDWKEDRKVENRIEALKQRIYKLLVKGRNRKAKRLQKKLEKLKKINA